MAQRRFTVSVLGKYLEPKIYDFLMENINHTRNSEELDTEYGAELTANAIAYGISLALSSDFMKLAFDAGIVPIPIPPATVTPGQPLFGSLIYNILKPNLIET